MEKIIDGYLTGFGSVLEMERLEEYYDGNFTDAGMSELRHKDDFPSRAECDLMCSRCSKKVIEYVLPIETKNF